MQRHDDGRLDAFNLGKCLGDILLDVVPKHSLYGLLDAFRLKLLHKLFQCIVQLTQYTTFTRQSLYAIPPELADVIFFDASFHVREQGRQAEYLCQIFLTIRGCTFDIFKVIVDLEGESVDANDGGDDRCGLHDLTVGPDGDALAPCSDGKPLLSAGAL